MSATGDKHTAPVWMDRLQVVILFAILVVHPTDFAFDLFHPQGPDTRRHVLAFLGFGAADSGKHVYVTLADLLVLLGFALYVVRWVWRRDWLRLPRVPLPTLLLGLWFLLSAVPFLKGAFGKEAGLDKMGFVKEFAQLFEYLVAAYLLFDEGFRDRRRRVASALILMTLTTIIVFWAWVQYLNPSVDPLRVSGPLATRNSLGVEMAMLLPFCLGVGLHSRRGELGVWACLLLAAGLLVVLSGGALVALCLGVSIVAFRRGRWAFVGIGAGVLLIVGIVLPELGAMRGVMLKGRAPGAPLPVVLTRDNIDILADSLLFYRRADPHRVLKWTSLQPRGQDAEDFTDQDAEWAWRQKFKEWQVSILMIARSPLFGVGGGSFVKNIGPGGYYNSGFSDTSMPKPSEDLMEPEAQCFYLTLAAAVGLPGVFFIFWLLLDHASLAARGLARRGLDRGIAAGALGGLVGWAAASVFAEPLVRGAGLTFVILLALASGVGRESERSA